MAARRSLRTKVTRSSFHPRLESLEDRLAPALFPVEGSTDLSTFTELDLAPNPAVFGQEVTLTATVTYLVPGSPAGDVTFFDNATTLGSATLIDAQATFVQATFVTSALGVGSHFITATYTGDAIYSASSTDVSTFLDVSQASTSTTLVAASASVQAMTLSAAVEAVAPGAGTPSGPVTFLDGATVLGTAPLVDGQGTFVVSNLAVGAHAFTASYAETANFHASSSATLPHTVVEEAQEPQEGTPQNPFAGHGTVTVLDSAPNPSVFGQAVMFTAIVEPEDSTAPGTPTGAVQFFDGEQLLGTATLVGGEATFTISTLAVGSHSIVANYQGGPSSSDATFDFDASISFALSTVVSPVSLPASVSVVPGSTPQGSLVGVAFAAPLAVDVRNAAGNLVEGVPVTFTAPSIGPSGKFGISNRVTVTTDSAGRATAPPFVANAIAGSYTVVASAGRFSAAFSLHNSGKLWTGAAFSGWSDPANWGGIAPVAGDHLVFGPGASTSSVNDLPADFEVASITFSGGDHVVTGNRLGLGEGGITALAGNINLNIDFIITPICPPIVTAPGSQVTLAGILSGPGGMHKGGAGTVILSGANIYDGETHVAEGVLRIENALALGSTALGTEVMAGAGLELTGGIAVNGESLTLNPDSIIAVLIGLRSVEGNNSWSGPINMLLPHIEQENAVSLGVDAGSQLTVSGIIDGTSNTILKKVGDGTLILNAANTYAGKTVIDKGVLRIENDMALGATDMGAEVMPGAELQLQGDIAVNGESLTLNPSSIIAVLQGLRSVEGNNSWSGPINMALPFIEQDNLVSVEVDARSHLTVSGIIDGTSNTKLQKVGEGALVVSGANTFLGDTVIEEGTLLVNGRHSAGAIYVDGRVLGGSGIVGRTQVLSGSLRPGNSPDILTVAGDAAFAAGSSFVVELNGTKAGSRYDQLNVQGAVTLRGATLQVIPGFAAAVGDRFIIVNNDGKDAVQGTFAGLAEKALFAAGRQTFRINYTGGDGNDVELIRWSAGLVDGDLVVTGTEASDTIRIVPDGNTGKVRVLLNGEDQGTWTLGAGAKIICHGLGGDDDIQVAGGIDHTALLFGDDGHDRLKGGGGASIIVGGAGDDTLLGKQGRDLLIGGTGADRIIGNAQDDILIAGSTRFDSDVAALCAIMAEWGRSDRTFAQRVQALRDGVGYSGPLLDAANVSDDDAVDTLTGSSGQDWFLFNESSGTALDHVTDLSAAEAEWALDTEFVDFGP